MSMSLWYIPGWRRRVFHRGRATKNSTAASAHLGVELNRLAAGFRWTLTARCDSVVPGFGCIWSRWANREQLQPLEPKNFGYATL